jgi:hypothetical protein
MEREPSSTRRSPPSWVQAQRDVARRPLPRPVVATQQRSRSGQLHATLERAFGSVGGSSDQSIRCDRIKTITRRCEVDAMSTGSPETSPSPSTAGRDAVLAPVGRMPNGPDQQLQDNGTRSVRNRRLESDIPPPGSTVVKRSLAGSILSRPSCGGVPFHTSSDKTEKCGSVGQGQRPTLAGPVTGKVLAAGAAARQTAVVEQLELSGAGTAHA